MEQNIIIRSLDIASFNILYGGKDDYRQRDFRKNAVIQALRSLSPDSFGLQEALTEWMDILTPAFPDYGIVALGRDAENTGEANPIFYKKDKFELLDSGTFWLSETPDIPSRGWDGGCNRICSWALLREKATGFRYAHWNTHLDVSSEQARQNGAKLIAQRLASTVPAGVPSVVTGDFNAPQGDATYRIMLESGFVDSKSMAQNASDGSTFHGYAKLDEKEDRPIDYVFAAGDVREVSVYRIVREQFDGMYPSDHYPVFARISLGYCGE